VKSAERPCASVSPARFGTSPEAAALDELRCGVGLTFPELDGLGEALVDERADADLAGSPDADLDGFPADDDEAAGCDGGALHATTNMAANAIQASGHHLVRRARTIRADRHANFEQAALLCAVRPCFNLLKLI
jgi:hypothetical protein